MRLAGTREILDVYLPQNPRIVFKSGEEAIFSIIKQLTYTHVQLQIEKICFSRTFYVFFYDRPTILFKRVCCHANVQFNNLYSKISFYAQKNTDIFNLFSYNHVYLDSTYAAKRLILSRRDKYIEYNCCLTM